MDGFGTTRAVDVVDSCSPTLSFTWFDKIVLVWGVVMVFVDLFLDTSLVYKHFVDGNIVYFVCTLVFVLLPSWIATSVSLRWYAVQSRSGSYQEYKIKMWVTVTCHVLPLAVAYRSFASLFYGVRSQDTKRPPEQRRVYYQLMLWEDNDASVLRLIEAFLEAVPQVLLQAYILNTTQQSPSTELWQKMAIVMGTLSAAWAVVSYVRTVRLSREDSPNISWPATAVCFLWRLFVLAPRLTAFALFAVRFTWILFPICLAHWFLMFIWLSCGLHIRQFQKRSDNLFLMAVLAGVYIFCMVDLSHGKRLLTYVFFYTVAFFENALLLGLWFLFVQLKPWYTTLVLVGSFCSFCLGIAFMMVYYVWMHPNASVIYPATNNRLEVQRELVCKVTPENPGDNDVAGAMNGKAIKERKETQV